jgi:muramidase (phage lysozyme)
MNQDELRKALANSNVTAFRMVLRFGESRLTPDGYRLRYHPSRITFFTGFAAHPRIFERTPAGRLSSAAGAYQFTWTTWRDEVLPVLQRLYGFTGDNFSPEMQDAGCVILFSKTKNALPLIIAGRLEEAVAACRGRWTSLPGAAESQRRFTMAKAREIYTQYGGQFAAVAAKGRSIEMETPMPLPVILPIVAALVPEIIKLFQPRIQAEVSRSTGADPEAAAQFMQVLLDKLAGFKVTTEPEAIAAVGTVLAAPVNEQSRKIAELETFTVSYLSTVEPYIDRIAQIDADMIARTEASRIDARAFDTPDAWKLRWAQATFTQKTLGWAVLVIAALIALMQASLIWIMNPAVVGGTQNLLGQLVVLEVALITGLVATFRDQNGFSYGGTSDGEARAVARSVINRDQLEQERER